MKRTPSLLILACLFAVVTSGRAAEVRKLNLLYITADDMNADSPGWMGSKMGATPTLDALAKAGNKDERIASRVKQLRVGEPQMFFNEITDRAERINLINDPNLKPEIERLAQLLLAHMEKTADPQTANFKKALADWRARSAKN